VCKTVKREGGGNDPTLFVHSYDQKYTRTCMEHAQHLAFGRFDFILAKVKARRTLMVLSSGAGFISSLQPLICSLWWRSFTVPGSKMALFS
jgi:hypothetical protein